MQFIKLPTNETEAFQMVRDKTLLRFQPYSDIDTTHYYLVDVFARDWSKTVDAYTIFVPGGLYFVVSGCNLKNMINTCPEELRGENQGTVRAKTLKLCFKSAIQKGRTEVINLYTKYLYSKPTNTTDDFKALCQRSRHNRFQNRLKFTYKIVKSIQCNTCDNSCCVYDALKLFYCNDKKCEREVDYTVSRNSNTK
ncbi:LEF-2 [Pseudalatia unipuncta granulovirus]|uniref:LEF-2 n=1 Tax=Pseudalatia unipuncta granulosis virus TaxID=36355 RepID=B6S6Q2_GVPU|nr:LEF-2 [Pseudalatia unipuncta granulovirus]ACH69383.1 LEF-2 [Pseudalatia unipuncta granulovirus]